MSTGYQKYMNWKKSKSGSDYVESKDNKEIEHAQG